MKGSLLAFPRICWILAVHLKHTLRGAVNFVCTTNSPPWKGTLWPCQELQRDARQQRGRSSAGHQNPGVSEGKPPLGFTGIGSYVLRQGSEPWYTGGKIITTAGAPALVPAGDNSLGLDFSLQTVQGVTSQALTSFRMLHTSRSSQNLLEPTVLAQTHRRALSLMVRSSTPTLPGWQFCLACLEEGPRVFYKLTIVACKILDQHYSKIF